MTSIDAEGAGRPLFRPLRLVAQHLDEIEAIWMQRRALLFSTRALRRDTDKVDKRWRRHLRALAVLDRVEVRREAELRLHSPVPGEVFGAALVLAVMAPSAIMDERGRVRVARRNMFPVLDALRHAPQSAAKWREGASSLVLDAASYYEPIPELALLDALASADDDLRRAALFACGRHPAPTAALLGGLERAFGQARRSDLTLIAYSIGLAAPDEFDATMDRVARGDAIDCGVSPVVLGMFGGARSAGALGRCLKRYGPAADTLMALGLLGLPETLPALVVALDSDVPRTQHAALTALRTLTGVWFVREASPGPIAPQGTPTGALSAARIFVQRESNRRVAQRSTIDVDAARQWTGSLRAGERYHLGVSLDGLVSEREMPESYNWLRALRTRAPGNHRFETPDWLFDEGYGARTLPRDHLFAALAEHRE